MPPRWSRLLSFPGKTAKVKSLLGIPEKEVLMSVIAVGKRSAEPSVRPRKELDEVVRFF